MWKAVWNLVEVVLGGKLVLFLIELKMIEKKMKMMKIEMMMRMDQSLIFSGESPREELDQGSRWIGIWDQIQCQNSQSRILHHHHLRRLLGSGWNRFLRLSSSATFAFWQALEMGVTSWAFLSSDRKP